MKDWLPSEVSRLFSRTACQAAWQGSQRETTGLTSVGWKADQLFGTCLQRRMNFCLFLWKWTEAMWRDQCCRMDGKMELITCSTDGESEFYPILLVLSLLINQFWIACLLCDNLDILREVIVSQRLPAGLPGHGAQLDGTQRGARDSPRALC